MQEDLKMYGNQYTYAVSTCPSHLTFNPDVFPGNRLHLRIRSHASSINTYHPEDTSKLLARFNGNRLGNLHIRASRSSKRLPALRLPVPSRFI